MEGHDQESPKKESLQRKKNAGHGKDKSFSPSQHQLQGSARVTRDHCADWHNHVEKWEVLNDAGFNLINKIINLRLDAKSEKETKSEVCASQETGMEYLTERHDGMPEGMESLCEQLTNIHRSMTALVEKMSAITKHFLAVKKLEEKRGSEELLFQTWPVRQFVKSSQDLEEVYKQELEVKRAIVEDVAHHDDRDTMMMYASCWLHQAYVGDEATVILESMLTETGFR